MQYNYEVNQNSLKGVVYPYRIIVEDDQEISRSFINLIKIRWAELNEWSNL